MLSQADWESDKGLQERMGGWLGSEETDEIKQNGEKPEIRNEFCAPGLSMSKRARQ